MKCFVIVREETPSQFTAWPAGIPELKVTAESRERVRDAVYSKLYEWMRSGELIGVDVPEPHGLPESPWGVDPQDPLQIEYMEAIERFRREDRERTIREIEEIERQEAAQQKAS